MVRSSERKGSKVSSCRKRDWGGGSLAGRIGGEDEAEEERIEVGGDVGGAKLGGQ